jgi:hypothetical protein
LENVSHAVVEHGSTRYRACVARTIRLEPEAVVLGYSGLSAFTRVKGEIRVPYEQIRSASVGLEEVPSTLAFRVGLSTAPFGGSRKGQFWWAGKRVFLDFEEPERAVVLELKGHPFARIAVQPDTDPELLAEQIRERLSASRP